MPLIVEHLHYATDSRDLHYFTDSSGLTLCR